MTRQATGAPTKAARGPQKGFGRADPIHTKGKAAEGLPKATEGAQWATD